ncbi:MAG: 16S rRNA (cytosine(1402)-N(4))-methyltransferase RsmH [Bacteroidia bacterium]|nr:16S rRNA (cytosine(1402)-N(4))-methyltransferase RsmH [Bacteroidia bacterium]
MKIGSYHTPVLKREVVEALVTTPEGTYVDATFGGGGHSRAIVDRLSPQGRLIGIDRDPEAPFETLQDPRFIGIRGNFENLSELLHSYGISEVDGILADLGVSSHQLDTPHRGFSYRHEAPLDLRMNPQEGIPARLWLGQVSQENLADVLLLHGDLPKSRRLAAQIKRHWHPNFTTTDLVNCARKVYGLSTERYLPPLFQAIRIAVNAELEALQQLLMQAPTLLKPAGRLVILTYHSGEARIVKNLYQQPEKEDPVTGQRKYAWRLVDRLSPSPEEVRSNPRSRSARLWICERL